MAPASEQVLQFAPDVAVVHVERRHPGPPGAEHALDVLGSVVGIDAEQVLSDLMAGQRRPLGAATQALAVEVAGQPVRPFDGVRVGETSIARDDELAVADDCGDRIDGTGDGEVCRL